MNKCFSILKWLSDPFGNKELSKTHTNIRRRMVQTKTRAEDTTEMVKRYPIGHTLRRRSTTPTKHPTHKGA